MRWKKLTTEKFISNMKLIHGDKYDYSLVDYISNKIKVKIICPIHGVFKQEPKHHTSGHGCMLCSNDRNRINDIIAKFKKIHKNKYNYSLVKYTTKQTNVKIICQLHGIFLQQPASHLLGCGCPNCSKTKKLTSIDFINKSKEIHGEYYDYTNVDYVNIATKVNIICPKHGVFQQLPKSHKKGHGCYLCKESEGEKKILNFLLKNSIEFIRQQRFTDCRNIRMLPFDFYLPKHNLCIEFDGLQHFKPIELWGGKKRFLYIKKCDNIKNIYCREKKIKLIRISYKEDILIKLKYL